MQHALHCTDWLLLGQSRNSRYWCAQSIVTERTEGYIILMSGWEAPYFSPGSERLIQTQLQVASEKGLGDCAHARDVVLAQASMTYVVRALYEYMYVRMLGRMSIPLYVHVTHTQHTHTRTHNTHTPLSVVWCCDIWGLLPRPGKQCSGAVIG